MMKLKEILITIVITLMVCCLFGINFYANKYVLNAENIYQVYINGQIIGYIQDKNELYRLINKKQEEAKKEYNVKEVYPPETFQIINTNSYDVELSTVEDIYNQVATIDTFTIQGYTIKIKDKEDKVIKINVLNKELFDEAIQKFVHAFITEEQYDAYINDEQVPIETTGKLIDLMYFDEEITTKKGYISIKEKIYTDATELSQLLLFGENYKIQKYEVKSGDTIETISDANKLNTQEFLIANPQYKSVDSLLSVGTIVNITLINPILTFSYDVTEVSDIEIPYEKKTEYDSSKSADYSEITTPGVKGITRTTLNYVVKNGETQGGVITSNQQVITEKVDQVTTVGKPSYSWGGTITGNYVDTGAQWQWPTNYPYIITSNFGWRWGVIHEGVDISGTGYNSPVYAALDGTVVSAQWEGLCGWGGGYCIVLQHDNGYSTLYAHLAQGSFKVSVGDRVSRGQVIAGMGSTGNSTGVHLHFGLWQGLPARGTLINPLTLW